MKNTTAAATLTLLFGFVGSLFFLNANKHTGIKKIPKKDRMDLAWAQEQEMTQDPKTGDVPKGRLLEAYSYLQTLKQRKSKAAIIDVNWTERGPNNCGGRTRTILVDLNDTTRKTIWAGSVSGGLWKTTDITAAEPNWQPVNDFLGNIAINSLAQSTQNPQHLYFGTGEGQAGGSGVRGLGVWKSTDGGASWNQLSATNNSNFNFCQKVLIINVDTVLVATFTGLYRTVNGGSSFTKVLGSSGASSNTAFTDNAYDIERAGNGTLYASFEGSIHKSYNKGATWTSALTLPISAERIELGLSGTDTNYVYAVVELNSQINGILRSINAGSSFTSITEPVDADSGIPSTDFSRGQAWYDISIAVNPKNPRAYYVGGIDLFKTRNSGTTWQQVSHWYGGFGFQEVHADQHFALYDAVDTSVVYFGNDGGVYRTTNSHVTIPTITRKEINYKTAQFYACAIHPSANNNYFLAGSQDNGSHQFTAAGINATTEVTGGDGAFCHIDQTQPSYQFTSYVYNNYFRSNDGGATFTDVISNNTGRFINPTDYDDSLNILYGAQANGTFLRWSNPQTGNSTSNITVTAFSSQMVSAVKVSPNTIGKVFFGTGNGRVVVVSSANSVSGTVAGSHINSGAGMPTGYISCIEVETGNDNHLLVTYTNYGTNSVWETTDGGATWNSIEGNLPDMPIRWVVFNPLTPTQALVATELGVWSSDYINGSLTDWQPTSTGLANVRCDMIKIRQSDKMMIVATYGRGLFSSDVFCLPSAGFSHQTKLTYPYQNIAFVNGSVKATSYYWDFGDGTTSTLANPLKSYTYGGTFTVTLTINGGVSNTTSTVKVLPFKAVPYYAADGGNFEFNFDDFASIVQSGTPFELGNSSVTGKAGTNGGFNAWVTGLTGNYLDNTVAYLYTPSFNFSASGNYTIQFYAKNSFEIGYDGYILQYSTNAGNTWLPLATTTSLGWYDFANTSGSSFAAGQAYFNANNSAYNLKSYTTNALQGNTQVSFRFVFLSDFTVVTAGVAIDDFEVLGPSNAALPINLLSFLGKRINNQLVNLQWQTATEINAALFEIERTFDWNAPFEKVGTVNAKGHTTTNQNYTLADANSYAYNSYYRLKMVDKDGKFEYSKTITVAGVKANTTQLVSSIIPTDVNRNKFVLTTNNTTSLAITILNNQGQVVKQGVLQSGQLLDCTELSTGIYYCQFVATNGQTQTEKLLVK